MTIEQEVSQNLAHCLRQAEEGVNFDPVFGARCPWCNERLQVEDSKAWVGRSKTRYQKCVNEKCPMFIIDRTIKTIQIA